MYVDLRHSQLEEKHPGNLIKPIRFLLFGTDTFWCPMALGACSWWWSLISDSRASCLVTACSVLCDASHFSLVSMLDFPVSWDQRSSLRTCRGFKTRYTTLSLGVRALSTIVLLTYKIRPGRNCYKLLSTCMFNLDGNCTMSCQRRFSSIGSSFTAPDEDLDTIRRGGMAGGCSAERISLELPALEDGARSSSVFLSRLCWSQEEKALTKLPHQTRHVDPVARPKLTPLQAEPSKKTFAKSRLGRVAKKIIADSCRTPAGEWRKAKWENQPWKEWPNLARS